jgi:competence protein ComEA
MAKKLNLNDADVEELTQIRGVGDKIARKIVDYREQHGPFKSCDDLKKIPGFSQTEMEALKKYVTCQ